MKNIIILWLVGLMTLASYGQNCSKYPQPVVGQRVYDLYNKIDKADKVYLQNQITEYEKATGIQMAVITLRSLKGVDPDIYATKIGNCWGIGDADLDNGILILVSFEDRQYAIKTGYGMEPYLTDFKSETIAQRILVPGLQGGKHSSALRKSVDAIIDHLGWQSWPDREQAHIEKKMREKENGFMFLMWISLLAGLVSMVGLLFLIGRRIEQFWSVKRKIISWKKDLKDPNITGVHEWPYWAQMDLQEYYADYEKGLKSVHEKEKSVLRAAMRESHDSYEHDLHSMGHKYSELYAMVAAIYAIPGKIASEAIRIEKAVRSHVDQAMDMKTVIKKMIQDGFQLIEHEIRIDTVIGSYGTIVEGLEQSIDPNRFSRSEQSSNNLIQEVQTLEKDIDLINDQYGDVTFGRDRIRVDLIDLAGDLYRDTIANMNTLRSMSSSDVYGKYEVGIASAKNNIVSAEGILKGIDALDIKKPQELLSAHIMYRNAKDIVDGVKETYASIALSLAQQQKGKSECSNMKILAQRSLDEANEKVIHEYVSQDIKDQFAVLENNLTSADELVLESKLIDWYKLYITYESIKDSAQVIKSEAEGQIADRIVANSYIKSGNSDNSDSDYDDNDTDYNYSKSLSDSGGNFGGGSFGGGGSSGGW